MRGISAAAGPNEKGSALPDDPPNESALRAEAAQGGEEAIHQSANVVAGWRTRGVPFFWIAKEAMRLIDATLEQSEAATAKLVYMALARLACDRNSGTFSVPITLIASLASQHRRTVERRLPDLERLGLVRIQRAALRAAHTYTVTTFSRNEATDGRSDATQRSPQPVALLREQENREGESRPVEFPRGFPATEEEAALHAAFCGCEEAFAKRVWNEAAARGGTDIGGNPVTRWRSYLSARIASDRSSRAERQQRNSFSRPTQTPNHAGGFV